MYININIYINEVPFLVVLVDGIPPTYTMAAAVDGTQAGEWFAIAEEQRRPQND